MVDRRDSWDVPRLWIGDRPASKVSAPCVSASGSAKFEAAGSRGPFGSLGAGKISKTHNDRRHCGASGRKIVGFDSSPTSGSRGARLNDFPKAPLRPSLAPAPPGRNPNILHHLAGLKGEARRTTSDRSRIAAIAEVDGEGVRSEEGQNFTKIDSGYGIRAERGGPKPCVDFGAGLSPRQGAVNAATISRARSLKGDGS